MLHRTLHLSPLEPRRLGDYDLDAVAIEIHDDETELDFRFELGQGLGIFWALPAGRHEMLRLAHVDGAAYDLPEPILIEAPWRCDVAPLLWEGELGELPSGRRLVAVRVEATASPASYCCELVTRRVAGDELITRLAWRENEVPWNQRPAAERERELDRLIATLAAAPELDIGGVVRVFDEGGRLFDEGYLDGARYEAVHELMAAARRGEPSQIRAALERCRVWGRPS